MPLEWYDAVEVIRPHVVRISTPRGSGTGFLVARGTKQHFVVLATAAHVVDHEHQWEEPIRIDHVSSGKSEVLHHSKRAIFLASGRDTAAILFAGTGLDLPATVLDIAPKDRYLKVGGEIGWLGFPSVSPADMCFFAGRVSAMRETERIYLVDGVTIHGVSGGPAFQVYGTAPVIIGVVSAYIPNRALGEALPGLGVVRDVTQFHELATTFASLDQAQAEQSAPEANAGW